MVGKITLTTDRKKPSEMTDVVKGAPSSEFGAPAGVNYLPSRIRTQTNLSAWDRPGYAQALIIKDNADGVYTATTHFTTLLACDGKYAAAFAWTVTYKYNPKTQKETGPEYKFQGERKIQ